MITKWVIKKQPQATDSLIEYLQTNVQLDPIVIKLLLTRNLLSPLEIEKFINPKIELFSRLKICQYRESSWSCTADDEMIAFDDSDRLIQQKLSPGSAAGLKLITLQQADFCHRLRGAGMKADGNTVTQITLQIRNQA